MGPDGIAVLNRDDVFFDFWQAEKIGQRKSVSFGFAASADVRAENINTHLDPQGFNTGFDLITGNGRIAIRLMLAGEHNVKNALAAAAVALQFGIGLEDIKIGLERMQPVIGRMQALHGRKGNIVIDDTYNANPASLRAALEAISQCDQPIWLAMGSFGIRQRQPNHSRRDGRDDQVPRRTTPVRNR